MGSRAQNARGPAFPPAGVVTSVITTRSVKELDLQVGTEVLAFVKATEVSVAKL
ncbi:TOBE domain protein [Bordetella hinzii OH87 BAL007II]|uniref:TOBE domain protein n=1 Tax=Bordetella hinzii OH87 BAL007II TaxID=1331262 RepID=A0ABR4R002_9BORD|nr:TOBE domain protein [Bordetella hinzii OH87 BAL007II]QDJ42171.1 hypothetical protein CBR70_13150 [Bordetella hinzii]QDJ55650.1 hypothetical protein CBR72_12845 [Bordetella hinzii]